MASVGRRRRSEWPSARLRAPHFRAAQDVRRLPHGSEETPKAFVLHFRAPACPWWHRMAPWGSQGATAWLQRGAGNARVALLRACAPSSTPQGASGIPKATPWQRRSAESARIALLCACVPLRAPQRASGSPETKTWRSSECTSARLRDLAHTAGRFGRPEGYRIAPKRVALPHARVPLRAPPSASGSPTSTAWLRSGAEGALPFRAPACPSGHRRAPRETRVNAWHRRAPVALGLHIRAPACPSGHRRAL